MPTNAGNPGPPGASATRAQVATMTTLLTERDTAALYKVTQKTLQGWRYRGVGPRFVKAGRCVRYRLEDLQAFVLAALRTSTSDRGRPAVYSPRPGITITRVAEHERVLDRPPAAACTPSTPRPAPGVPTWRRHGFPRIRIRARLALPNQHVGRSAQRPAR